AGDNGVAFVSTSMLHLPTMTSSFFWSGLVCAAAMDGTPRSPAIKRTVMCPFMEAETNTTSLRKRLQPGEFRGKEHRHPAAAIVSPEDRRAAEMSVGRQAACAGAFTDIDQQAVRAGAREDGLPRLVDERLVRLAIDPPVADAAQHRRRNHRGGGVLRIGARSIDDVAPHP